MLKKITTIILLSSITYSTGFALLLPINSINNSNGYATIVPITAITSGTDYSELISANNLAKRGIINDHSLDIINYNLNDNVLRQEIAAIARGVAKLDKKTKCDNIYADVSENIPNTWACLNIEPLVDNNLISKNNKFRPEDKITKSEAVAMLIKAIGFDYSYDPSKPGNWQKQVVDFAVEVGVLENFTDYDTFATRGWIFKVADTTIEKDEELKGSLNEVLNETNIYSNEAILK